MLVMHCWHFPESNHTRPLCVLAAALPSLWFVSVCSVPVKNTPSQPVLWMCLETLLWLGHRNETYCAQGSLQGHGCLFWGRTSPPSALDLRWILGTACIHPLHTFIHSSPVSPHLSCFYFHVLVFWYFSPLLLTDFWALLPSSGSIFSIYIYTHTQPFKRLLSFSVFVCSY